MSPYELFALVGALTVLFLALLGLVNAAAVVLSRNFVPACREIGRSVYRRQRTVIRRARMRPAKRPPAAAKPNGKEAAV